MNTEAFRQMTKLMSQLEAERAGFTVGAERRGYFVAFKGERVTELPLYDVERTAWVAAAAFGAAKGLTFK